MSHFPKDPKKIRERIKRYERDLANEKRRFGGYDDSTGKRYLLGPLYLLLGDIDGANKSFAWFRNHFIVEWLLGIEEPRPDIRYGTNWGEPEYVVHGPTELFSLWDDDALAWAEDVYGQAWFKEARADYLEIERRLTNEPVGPERSRLVNRKFQLMKFEDVETGE